MYPVNSNKQVREDKQNNMVAVGSIVEGKVVSVMPFGAFVDIGNKQSGLVHISEISSKYVKDINECVKKGDAVKVKVIKIDDLGKISLSMKQAEEKMFSALDQDLATRFSGKKVRVFAAYSGEESVGESWKTKMEAHYGEKFVRIDPLALNICCHTGPGAIALGCAECEE